MKRLIFSWMTCTSEELQFLNLEICVSLEELQWVNFS